MTGPDPIRDLIATMFHDLDVAKSRGGYTLVDPHSGTPRTRLKPDPPIRSLRAVLLVQHEGTLAHVR